jgi:hypothetical protein
MAACVCIIENARGRPLAEAQLLAEWEPWRHPGAGDFSWEPAVERLGPREPWKNPDDPDFLAWVRARLGRPGWAIAWVIAKEYAPVAQTRLTSPYGALATFHHAVVICDVGPPGIQILDPFFDGGGQPLTLTDELAVATLSGHLLVPR